MRIQGTNLFMIRGDSESIRVTCRNELGEKIDLIDGDIVYLTVKKNTNTEEKLLQKVITEFIDGDALITIDPNDTKNLNVSIYYYDIQLNRATGLVKTIIPPSKFTLENEVTYE